MIIKDYMHYFLNEDSYSVFLKTKLAFSRIEARLVRKSYFPPRK
jgi:hypothetical protein